MTEEFYVFDGHIFNGNYEEHKSRLFKASRRTIRLEHKLDPTGDFLEVPAKLYAKVKGVWKRHPVVYFSNRDYTGRERDLVVILADGRFTTQYYKNVINSGYLDELHDEAKKRGLIVGTTSS